MGWVGSRRKRPTWHNEFPEASCVSIATTEWGGDAGGGLLAIRIISGADQAMAATQALSTNNITGASGTFTISDTTGYGLPVSVINASMACSGTENAIAWKYM